MFLELIIHSFIFCCVFKHCFLPFESLKYKIIVLIVLTAIKFGSISIPNAKDNPKIKQTKTKQNLHIERYSIRENIPTHGPR